MKNMIPAWEDGKLKPINKLVVHQRALRHKAISVFIISGNKTLVQRRALNKYHTPGLWANACCTHPHWEEEPRDCAARRLKEELGVTTSLDFIYRNQIEYKADVGNGLVEHELVDIFTLKTNDIKNIKIDINFAEVMAVRWVSFKDLKNEIIKNPEDFTPWLRIYLTEYADQILAK